MIDTIYFEEQVVDHPRALGLFERFPKAQRIPCSHYKEVFNPSGQNFRLQKKKPALILAKNSGKKFILFQLPMELVVPEIITSRICLIASMIADTVFFRGCTLRLITFYL